MNSISLVIEVYGGVVQNVYVAHESPDTLLQAVVVDWDYESYEAPDDCVVHATGLDGNLMSACVSTAQLKPWRLLPTAGILDVLDRAGVAAFGTPAGEAPPLAKGPAGDFGGT